MNKPLILWGGTDANADLYNKPRSKYAQKPDVIRDTKEKYLYELAVSKRQPVVGVCRGAQFICIMNGGELYQHSIPTRQSHDIMTSDGLFHNVAAGHHQVMKPSGNYEIMGWNPEPVKVWIDDDTTQDITNSAEVVWYPKTRSLAIQPHPEWSNPNVPFNVWINSIMEQLNIDFSFDDTWE